MPQAVHIPRVNNNDDDDVLLIRVLISVGDFIKPGQQLAEIETDKATIFIEAEQTGFVLGMSQTANSLARVGSVLAWIGETVDETIEDSVKPESHVPNRSTSEPTANAKALLLEHGLRAEDVPAQGERLTTDDVTAYLNSRSYTDVTPTPSAAIRPAQSAAASVAQCAPGRLEPLSMEARGMMRSVLWHRDEAVAAYLEISYNPRPWEEFAFAFAEQRRLLGNPVLALMTHKLAMIARHDPSINSTIINGQRFVYDHVNLGFTIQAQQNLYLVVIPKAEEMDAASFIKVFDQLHRKAIGHKLAPHDMTGATVAFTSMARWQASRHIPILPPYVSMIVAQSVDKNGRGVLGVTYDHRTLSGSQAIGVLLKLASPSDQSSPE